MVVAAACSSGGAGGDASGGGGDASAQLACREFYQLANDVDLLTSDEQRERVQGIWDKAEVSATPGIADAARRMLAAITANDMDSLERAVSDMDIACSGVEPL